MQVQKDNIRTNILNAAEKIFLEKGFAKANIREIAKASGVGLGNLYNYFASKDQIFRTLVEPTVKRLHETIYEHHSPKYSKHIEEMMTFDNPQLLENQIEEYVNLTIECRKGLELLLSKAQGSSMEDFVDKFTDICTEQFLKFMRNAELQYPRLKGMCHDFTYHLQSVWMMQCFNEIIKHKLKDDDIRQVVTDYVKFEFYGWRSLIN